MLESLYLPNAAFQTWTIQHTGWLVYGIVSTVFWIWRGQNARSEAEQQRIGWQMSLIGLAAWLYSEVMMLWHNQWELMSGVPLHLCYFLNFVLPFMLRRRLFWLFDCTYPIVLAGCFQALITPDLENGFPQFFNLKYWLVHIGLVQSALYAIFVFGFRPTFAGIFKCLLFFNAYAAIASTANWLLNANFMYLREKPPGTMLDFFGDWPLYIFGGELLALVLFFVAWLPFAGKRSVPTSESLHQN